MGSIFVCELCVACWSLSMVTVWCGYRLCWVINLTLVLLEALVTQPLIDITAMAHYQHQHHYHFFHPQTNNVPMFMIRDNSSRQQPHGPALTNAQINISHNIAHILATALPLSNVLLCNVQEFLVKYLI